MKTANELILAAAAAYTDVQLERVVPTATLEELGIDSMTLAEMLFYVEDNTHREVDVVTRPVTVADVTALIEQSLRTGKVLP